jgi:hypothetical protein
MRRQYFRVSIVVVAWFLTFGTSNQSYADVVTYTFTPDSTVSFNFLQPPTEIDGSFTIDTSGSQPTLVSASITFPRGDFVPFDGTFLAGSVLAGDEIQLARFIDGRFDQVFLSLVFSSDFGAPILGFSSVRLTDPNIIAGNLPLDVTGGGQGFAIAAVPEPSTWAMIILGFAGIGAVTYRRRKSAMLVA